MRVIHRLCKEHTFAVLACFQLVTLILVLLLCNIKYEVSDDFVMEMILSGTYTKQTDPHMMFSNVLWGGFLAFFYRLWPGISWYLIAQILICFVSYLAICYVVTGSTEWYTAIFSVVVITVFTAMDLYILPQFTKTAAAALIAGSMLFLWSLFAEKPWYLTLAGAMLALTGTLIRDAVVGIVGPSVAIYLVYGYGHFCRGNRKEGKRIAGRVLVFGMLLLSVIGVFRIVNGLSYKQDADYRYYAEYSEARAQIVDYMPVPYEACREELMQAGVSENDYNLILNWSFDTSDNFSLEKMQQVDSVLDQYRSENVMPIKSVIRGVLARRTFFYPGAFCCVIFGIYCIVLDKKKAWIPIISAAAIFAFFIYFYTVGRNVYRVEFGFFMSAAVLLACTCKGECLRKKAVSVIAAVLAALCIVPHVLHCLPDRSYESLQQDEYRTYVDETFYYSWNYDADKYGKTVLSGKIRPEFLKEVQSNPDNIYVLDFNTTIQTLYYDFSPFDSAADCFPVNLHYLGGVAIHHPAMASSGAYDGSLEALMNDSVYFVSNHTADMVLTYLHEHAYPDAKMELYAEVDGYYIWKYFQ